MVRPSLWALNAVYLHAVSLTAVTALPANAPQYDPHDKRQYPAPLVNRAQAVIDTFRLSWEGYYRYAFPNDELHPVTNTYGNSRYKYL
jgi:mannosyl-oligosaccharide alpha-1,2-mannosidase